VHRIGRSFIFTALAALVLLGLTTPSAAVAGAPASIAGTVSGVGAPDSIEVCAYREDQAGPIECADPVASTAEYEVTGLSAGTYFVFFRSAGCSSGCEYAPQWYEGAQRRADAKPIVLGDGAEATGIDATMSETASIEGRVLKASDDQPASGFEACAYRPGQTRAAACDGTPFEGRYRIVGLTRGEQYVVQFRPDSNCGGNGCTRENWGQQYYPGVAGRAEATLVEPSSNPEIDASLQPAATITGNVTEATGGAAVPAGSVVVCAYPVAHQSGNGTCGTVGANGNYTVQGVPSGESVVKFAPEYSCSGTCALADFAPQWFDGKGSAASAEPLTLTSGETKSGVDAAMAPGGKIHGFVIAASGGLAVENVGVCASIPQVGGPCTQTNSAGEYTLTGLATGSYVVTFRPSANGLADAIYNGKASESEGTPVAVTAGETTPDIDAALLNAASISGYVTEVGDVPLEGSWACAYPGSSTEPAACGETSADGFYEIERLPPATYTIHFAAPEECGQEGCVSANLVGQWYSGAATRATANTVTLAVGQGQAGIDAILQPGGRIAGTVTVPGGDAAQAVEACAYPAAGGEFSACATTEGDGYYEIAGLGTGSYKVEFGSGYECGEGACERSPYEAQFWQGAKSLSGATPVAVTAGTTQKGIDATMAIPAAPSATQPPTLSGTPAVGQTLTCGQSEWSGEPTGYAYAWLRDGTPIAGAAGASYLVTKADAGHAIACRVTATNAVGSTAADSAALEVPMPATPGDSGTSAASVASPAPGPPSVTAQKPAVGKATAKPVAKVKGGVAVITVGCVGGACKGSLNLTAKAKSKTVVLGGASFSLVAGRSTTVKVKLSKAVLAKVEEAGAKGLEVRLTGSHIKARSLKLEG
jgi:hypothetical protein